MTFSGRVKGTDVTTGLDSGQLVMALLFIFSFPPHSLQLKEQNKHFTKRFKACFHPSSNLDLLPQTLLDHTNQKLNWLNYSKTRKPTAGDFYVLCLLGRKGR